MTTIAHAGDWIEAGMLGLPAIAFAAWLVITQLRERRRGMGPQAETASGQSVAPVDDDLDGLPGAANSP